MSDLYQQEIKALALANTGDGPLAGADVRVRKDNRLCGDRIDLDLQLSGDLVAAVGHRVRGCLLCRAAASAIGQSAPGQSRDQLQTVEDGLRAMLKSEPATTPWPPSGWEQLRLFEPVRNHKSRHNCVLLPFEALIAALK